MRNALTIVIGLGIFVCLSQGRCHAQTYTWTATTGGSWTNGTDWGSTPADFPNNAGVRAVFSSVGNGSAKTVTLDAAVTLRRLMFNSDQTGSVTVAPGTGGSLTLDSTGTGQPTLDVQAGSGNHTIAANMSLVGSDVHKWNIDANQTLTVTGNIGGTQGLTKLLPGTLLLNGANTFAGPTTVSAGTLGGSGSIASNVTVAAGATITAGTSPAAYSLTLGGDLALNGKYLVTLFSPSSASQLILPSGTASLTGGTLQLALGPGVTVADFRAAGPRSFSIIDAPNGQLSGAFSTADFTTAGFSASEWTIGYSPASGNVTLGFAPVPEPGAVLGVAAAGLLAAWGVRWRRRPGHPGRRVNKSHFRPAQFLAWRPV
jgi:autotransporter-associated beta strand protein